MKLLYILLKHRAVGDRIPIYLRITIEKRAHFFTNQYITLENWDQESQICRGRGYGDLNKKLLDLKVKAQAAYDDAITVGIDPTSGYVKSKLDPSKSELPLLSEIMQRYIDHKVALGDWGDRYISRNERTKKLILEHGDDYVISMKKSWIPDFHSGISKKHNLGPNMSAKYVEMLKTALTWAEENEIIPNNPFRHYKAKRKTVKKKYLTQSEVDAIMNQKLSNGLSWSRDIFIFMCYSGLEYSRVKALTMDMIDDGMDGKIWIYSDRSKTDQPGNVPLFPVAKMMLDRYANDPCREKGLVFPVRSNQKFNEYLKVVADVSGVNKNVTTHLARHTFSTTVWLRNGGDMVTLSKILGHKDVRTTQRNYADIVDARVADDYDRVLKKMSN